MPDLPAVFLSHGAPTLAVDPGPVGPVWRQLAADLPRPAAILVVSAHWGTAEPVLSVTEKPTTIHDFGGFPDPLYEIEYPAPGAPWLAGRAGQLLTGAGLRVSLNPDRGLDHGAWVPLRVIYPAADVPVVQLSLQPRLGPDHHYRVGLALARLAGEGVLILASGSLTHNLYDVDWGVDESSSRVPAYVRDFQSWFHEKLMAGDLAALLDYRRQAPGAERAHPTDEHLLPIFVALGAGGEAPPERLYAGISEGALAMDVYRFGPAD